MPPSPSSLFASHCACVRVEMWVNVRVCVCACTCVGVGAWMCVCACGNVWLLSSFSTDIFSSRRFLAIWRHSNFLPPLTSSSTSGIFSAVWRLVYARFFVVRFLESVFNAFAAWNRQTLLNRCHLFRWRWSESIVLQNILVSSTTIWLLSLNFTKISRVLLHTKL